MIKRESIICLRCENYCRSIYTQRTRQQHTSNLPTPPPSHPSPPKKKCLDTLCFQPSLSPCDGVDPSTCCSRPSFVIGIKARDWSEEVTVTKNNKAGIRQIRKTRAHGTGYYMVYPALTMVYNIGKYKSPRGKKTTTKRGRN